MLKHDPNVFKINNEMVMDCFLQHIYVRRISDQTLEPLTSGTYEVAEILSWDEVNHIVLV